ncbi:MAG TPA: DUF1015 family protein [Verrucomicrobiae bacterium]|nr:DUF1015 family protein [Verrucomicrobiae bacterium]
MATVKPFAALRPNPELASQICELPYDVLSSEEARAIASCNPSSFFHVSRPEIDLPPGTNPYISQVYAKGGENFQKLIGNGALRRDTRPGFYLYRQIMGPHSQTGIVVAASCEEYLNGGIKRHELTRVDKEDDRVRHIEALNSQTGPVFLTCKAAPALEAFVVQKSSTTPEIDFTANDGVRHSAWPVFGPDEIKFIGEQFARIPFLYIADGHHRSAAAARVFQNRKGAGNSSQFLAVIFPHDRVKILPYNRVLKDLNGLSPEKFLKELEAVFVISKPGNATPKQKHEISLYLQGQWRTLTFREQFLQSDDPLKRLDVELLQRHVLAPVLGIENPRTSERIHFVGGIRGTMELKRLVDSGRFACAFSMFPTSMDDLVAVADVGEIMPPKSTWFEPKLRDGMFCQLI